MHCRPLEPQLANVFVSNLYQDVAYGHTTQTGTRAFARAFGNEDYGALLRLRFTHREAERTIGPLDLVVRVRVDFVEVAVLP